MSFLRFDYIPYPFWRHRALGPFLPLARPLLRRWFALDTDEQPPETPDAMAAYMARWNLLGIYGKQQRFSRLLEQMYLREQKERESLPDRPPIVDVGAPVRLPAQWEPIEKILLSWPVHYPPLWDVHAQMAAAISAVAEVEILVPSPLWADAVMMYVTQHSKTEEGRIRYLPLPTDDIWIRDYGPFVGLDANGEQVVVDAIFDPLPNYPQERDDAMALRWAAHHEIPARKLDLHIEGGNVWSDGAGTLLMTDDLMHRHRDIGRDEVLRRLHEAFDFQKLVLLPPLAMEETSHVDLLTKLADAQTVLVSAPTNRLNRGQLLVAAERLRRETNAQGQPYRVLELPMPPLYMNWGIFPVWRTYTNALTVNGRVLVPTFGVSTDDEALDIYRRAMPDHEIVPINCAATANGGGAVHCLTKEVPRAQNKSD